MNAYPLLFKPIPQQRIWGGQKLANLFNIQETASIGEIWTLSDHPNSGSVCINGELAGQSLHDIMKQFPHLYLGHTPHNNPSQRFPLLIKFLHAEDDLSVQIHPDDEYALTHEQDFGKSEAWYILEAEMDTHINYGHTFTNKNAFLKAVEDNQVQQHLLYHPVEKDDFVYIPARTLHALLKGTMVLEIQQTSDVTYRVFDWDRKDDQGNHRQLHIEEAANVLSYGEQSVSMAEGLILACEDGFVHERLIRCPFFTIEKMTINTNTGQTITQGIATNPDVLVVIGGAGILTYSAGTQSVDMHIQIGDTLLLPSSLHTYLIGGEDLTVLRAYYESKSFTLL